MNSFCLQTRWVLCLLAYFGYASILDNMTLAASAERVIITEQDLHLVPFPKEIRLQTGLFSFPANLTFEVSDVQSKYLIHLLNSELRRIGWAEVRAGQFTSAGPAFRLATAKESHGLPDLPQKRVLESYAMEVRTNEIACAARDASGLFYGLQTLCQLIRANHRDNAIPCLQIRDWPSLRWRCFQDDMTRGPSSTLETLNFEAAMASYLKLNLMTYYMEYQFAFRKHPKIGPVNGSLAPEELSALIAYAKPLHLEILGNQQSFGHFGQILKHSEYESLRETSEILTPVREETYRFLDDLYSEVCPLLPFPWFNVCCDETEGLGSGPSQELAKSIGVGGVYVRHIRRVHDLLRDNYKKRMMMWGDIILQHPDRLSEIPKDTIMLTWGYDARANFESQIIPFSQSGYDFFICPGVSDWSRILPDFGVAITNIQNFVRDGAKHGALGMINTDWEDDGEALKAVKWHADAWAAECAWNASQTSIEAFNRRIGAVLFGERGNHFGQAIELLAQTHRLPAMKGMFNSRFWEKDFSPQSNPPRTRVAAHQLLTIVRPAIEHLETCLQQARCNQHVLEVILFGARRMELIGQRMLDGLEAAQDYQEMEAGAADLTKLNQIEQLLRKNRDAHERMGREFASLWLRESKPFALDWTLRRYTNLVSEYDHLLRNLEKARQAILTERPIPAADEIGLAPPKPLFRRIRPVNTFSERFAPELPWLELAATHRIGLVAKAGDADRFDLPLEVELALPAPLVDKPVRAFLLGNNKSNQEILAQLDPLEGRGKSRIVLLLPGWLNRGQEAWIHLYLGLTDTPPLLSSAVRTNPGERGRQWIENDQIRFLLGPEGGHLYRWEVRALGNRDLTMPGDTGWAGFSDQHALRGMAYQLSCKAHGPAMVEFECMDTNGDTKNIRFYGGVCWVEVLLSEPASVYWDFDNPKNFAGDGSTPGHWLFSNGQSGSMGREADGVAAQVKAPNTHWGIKYNADRLALGLLTPGSAALHVIAPGAGAGGVGIEGSSPTRHFVTFAGPMSESPADTMNRLQTTLDLKRPVEIDLYALQSR